MEYKESETYFMDSLSTGDACVEEYLKSLGIQKTDAFIYGPSKDDELSPWLLDNMERATALLKDTVDNNKKIFLVVDSDTDGYTSAAIIYRFIKVLNYQQPIEYYIHPEKQHGLTDGTFEIDTGLIIIPDAGRLTAFNIFSSNH